MTKSLEPEELPSAPLPQDPEEKRHQEAVEIALASGLTPEQAEKLVHKIEHGAGDKFDHNEIWLRFKFILTVYNEWHPALRDGLDDAASPDEASSFSYPSIARKMIDLANDQARYLSYEDAKLEREYLRFDREVAKEQERRAHE